jgi:hypothetical protein
LKLGGPIGIGAFLLKKQGKYKIKSTGMAEKVPKTVNGETVASQWLRAGLQRW